MHGRPLSFASQVVVRVPTQMRARNASQRRDRCENQRACDTKIRSVRAASAYLGDAGLHLSSRLRRSHPFSQALNRLEEQLDGLSDEDEPCQCWATLFATNCAGRNRTRLYIITRHTALNKRRVLDFLLVVSCSVLPKMSAIRPGAESRAAGGPKSIKSSHTGSVADFGVYSDMSDPALIACAARLHRQRCGARSRGASELLTRFSQNHIFVSALPFTLLPS